MRKPIVLLLAVTLVLPLWGCVVSEAEYQNIVSKNEALQKELAEAREENRLLNDSVLEIYREREKLLARITELESKVKRLSEAPKKADEKKPVLYVVKAGDTLSKIAMETDTPIETLRRLNSLNSDVVWVGQRLRLGKAGGDN